MREAPRALPRPAVLIVTVGAALTLKLARVVVAMAIAGAAGARINRLVAPSRMAFGALRLEVPSLECKVGVPVMCEFFKVFESGGRMAPCAVSTELLIVLVFMAGYTLLNLSAIDVRPGMALIALKRLMLAVELKTGL